MGSQAYKAGTYEASAEGRNGAVNVKVTFTDDAIDAIDVEHEESRNIGDAAIDILKDKYLQSQSLNFDTVTGASLSSMAFATAVAECVDQAGGDVKALKKADTGIEPAAAIDEDCDVCVVGSGGAALADNALDAVHWMEDHGLVYEKEPFTAIGGLWQRGHAVEVEKKGEQGGSYYVSCLKDSADKTGKVTLYTDAKVEQLVEEGGKVTGVAGTRPSSGASVAVRAKSVVLATGGYSRNAELAMEYDKRVTKDMPSSNVCSSTGDGLGLGEGVGAGLRNMDLVQIHPLGDPQNGGVATFVGNWLGVEDYVMVNDEGKRFIREDERRDTIADAILEQPNDEMWLLVDSTDIAADRADQIAELVEKGHSFKADDIEDLANQIGVPADALAETVEGYNACVKAGVDTQIAPGKELLGTELSDPAYYASKRIPTIHYTMGGLCITTDAQVCTEAGEPIPNLFACGEVTGGVQGGNRLGGNSFTDLIVFGRIAGASAVANA